MKSYLRRRQSIFCCLIELREPPVVRGVLLLLLLLEMPLNEVSCSQDIVKCTCCMVLAVSIVRKEKREKSFIFSSRGASRLLS